MWSAVVYEEGKSSPCSRSKHSVTLLGNHLYLLAGRNGNVPLKDFWRYDLENNKWELLKPAGDPPPCLQEHTSVTFRENIYVFGGELGFSGGNETPLWIYETKKNIWRKMKGQKGTSVPKGRRGHTTLVYRGSALVYGGYCDLRGSSNELWIFHFDTESWHLLMNGKTDPPGRHKHSAILHNDNMWIYGGMTDLQERSDLWRFDMDVPLISQYCPTATKKWFLIKCKVNPGPLHSHVACTLPSSMLLFGGERNGQLLNELWRFHFGAVTWQRIQMDIIGPYPISESCAVTISELLFQESNSKNENSPPVTLRRQRNSPNESRRRANYDGFHLSSSSHFSDFSYLPSAQGAMLPPRQQATTPNSCNLSFLKEITKLSHMNLSRLAQNGRCSYHMLDSNESINNIEETTNEDLNQFQLEPSSRFRSTRVSSTSSGILREVSSLVNTPLTPSDAAKLVYLEGEEAPISTVVEEFSTVHQRLHPSQNRNRRSYPSANSVRFANPLVTPEEPSPEITSDYASCENIHKLLSSNNRLHGNNGDRIKTSSKDNIISFSNPNYLTAQKQMVYVEEKISRGDYVKLNSPADSLLEESGSNKNKYEMTELRPKPPKSLPLTNGNNINIIDKRKKYRTSSAGRCNRFPANPVCVFLIGGKDHCLMTSFKKPISIWKLSLTKDVN